MTSPEKNGVMYKFTFPSGKIYIGITSQNLAQRISQHVGLSTSGRTIPLSNAIRKHGTNFERTVLVVGKMDYLRDLEVKAIMAFNCRIPNGYNTSFGGETSPSSCPEVAAKISASRMGYIPSQITRDKLSAITTANPPSKRPEVAAKISASNKGRKFTSEHCKNISIAQKALGENHPMKRPESRARMAILCADLAHRPSVRAKKSIRMMGDGNIAKRPDVRAKISATKLERNAMKRKAE